MPHLPRKGIESRPRRSYGKQRINLDAEESEAQQPDMKELLSSQQSNEGLKASGLKQGRSEALETPPQPKRASPAVGSSMTLMSKSLARLEGKDSNKGAAAALRASQELRETGQNHKFRDGIEFILDGVRSKDSQRIRRSSCLELTRSMLKDGYIPQVKAHHYMPIIFEATCQDKDPIVQSCLALMIGLLLQNPEGCKDIVAIDGMVQFLCQSLETDMDPMAMMPSGRQEVILFNDFKDLVRQSGILRKGQKVLIKSIILSSIARIIEECVALEDIRVLSIIQQDPQFLTFVVQSLIEDLAWIKEPSSTPDVSLSDVLDIGRIENSLRILERLAMVSSKPAAVLANNNRIFPLLVHLITLCRMHAFQYPLQTDALNIMLHVLRLLINVTNGNEPCCESLSQGGSIPVLVQNFVQFYCHFRNYSPEESETEHRQQEQPLEARLMGEDSPRGQANRDHWTREPSSSNLRPSWDLVSSKERSTLSSVDSGSESGHQDDDTTIGNNANGWYDLLLLSLGLLINMLEAAPPRRKQLTETAIGLDCKAVGDCFHKECRCDKSSEALERLVDIYNTEVTISEMTENQVLAAYLALLLCCVVEGNADDEMRLYKSVHGQSLAPMLDLLQGFTALHQAIQVENSEQELLSQDRLEPTLSLSTDGTPAPAGSFILPAFDSKRGDNEDEDDHGDDCQAADIVFVGSTKRAAETQASFLKIIQILQDMESRHTSLSKK